MRPFSEQFTLRGVVIGAVGCALITASSLYTALKLGALPWPIFFVVLLALFSLRLFARFGKPTNINEANVSATMMSAGAMVAGGLAFTVPALYLIAPDAELPLHAILLASLSGVALGVVGTALFRRQFIVEANLPYPIGTGAAETLKASFEGGKNALLLFVSAAVAAVVAVVRDVLALIPALLFSWVKIPGVTFGIYCSPMALAMGFLIGPLAALVWFAGGLIGDFGLVVGGTAAGWWNAAEAAGIKQSLGIGVMIGCGAGVVIKMLWNTLSGKGGTAGRRSLAGKGAQGSGAGGGAKAGTKAGGGAKAATQSGGASAAAHKTPFITAVPKQQALYNDPNTARRLVHPLAAVVVAAVVAVVLAVAGVLSPAAAILVVALVWIALLMAAQSTGQAGLNPMEVFGIIVLLVIALFVQLGVVELVLIAAVVTVACGFVGDMMNDFKAGHVLGTSPRAQWLSECMGGVIGALVSTAVLVLLVQAYGTDSFGVGEGKTFVAAQASAVAAMVGGIPNLPAFLIGLAIGSVLYLLRAPVITLGLGIYLPFYLTLTVALGAAVRFVVGLFAPQWAQGEKGVVAASGFLAGESIAGVVIALVVVFTGVMI